jgi:hypothetical protein
MNTLYFDADAVVTRGEADLWALTGAAAPDAVAIASKLDEIGRLRSAQRLAYIRNVGEAARLLTDAQRRQLVRAAAPRKAAPAGPKAAPASAPPASTTPGATEQPYE